MIKINNHFQNNCDHSHEHIHSDPGEIPAVFSASIPIQLKYELAEQELTSCLVKWINDLKQWAIDKHYLIGHIKSFIGDGENLKLWIATTGKNVNIKNTGEDNIKVKNITINITAIIFGTNKDTLQKITLDKLKRNLQICNISEIP